METSGLRKTVIERGVNMHAEGSARIACGDTIVLCTASVSPEVPKFLAGTNSGWITATYNMLPRSTKDRKPRDTERRSPDARSLEIKRLIGRSLRASVELGYLNSHSIVIDCDVLQADGGTRTASITGGMVALVEALCWMQDKGIIPGLPLKCFVAATSVGIVDGRPVLDLDYQQDASAQTDMNVVANDGGELIEVQATSERTAFSRAQLDQLLDLALGGIRELLSVQRDTLGEELTARLTA